MRILALASLLVLGATGCSSFVDEMKIRSDTNTLVNPDIWEMRDLEAREGVPQGSGGGDEESLELPPLPETLPGPGQPQGATQAGTGPSEVQLRAASAAASQAARERAIRNARPEQPLPDTAKELGTVPFDSIPGMPAERPALNPGLLQDLQN